jgi:hypothetical protein
MRAGPTYLAAEGRGGCAFRLMWDGPPRGAGMLPAPAGAAGECPPRPYSPEEWLPGRGWEIWGWMGEEGWPNGLRPFLP